MQGMKAGCLPLLLRVIVVFWLRKFIFESLSSLPDDLHSLLHVSTPVVMETSNLFRVSVDYFHEVVSHLNHSLLSSTVCFSSSSQCFYPPSELIAEKHEQLWVDDMLFVLVCSNFRTTIRRLPAASLLHFGWRYLVVIAAQQEFHEVYLQFNVVIGYKQLLLFTLHSIDYSTCNSYKYQLDTAIYSSYIQWAEIYLHIFDVPWM